MAGFPGPVAQHFLGFSRPASLLPAGRLARFNALVEQMPRIAEAIAEFDPDLREQAYYTLLNVLDPEPADPEPYVLDLVDVLLAYRSGRPQPLDFHGHPVPAAVRARLETAVAGADGAVA